MPLLTLDSIPGLRKAIAEENAAWDEAFLDVPEFICGVEVEQFTLSHFAVLNAIRSPFMFVNGGEFATDADIAMFMWAVSMDKVRALKWRNRIERVSKSFAKSVFERTKADYCSAVIRSGADKLRDGIRNYIDAALLDASRGDGSHSTSYWSLFSSAVSSLAIAFGWTEREIMTLPCKRVFQYLRIANKHINPNCILFKPSDRVIGDWIDQQNRRS